MHPGKPDRRVRASEIRAGDVGRSAQITRFWVVARHAIDSLGIGEGTRWRVVCSVAVKLVTGSRSSLANVSGEGLRAVDEHKTGIGRTSGSRDPPHRVRPSALAQGRWSPQWLSTATTGPGSVSVIAFELGARHRLPEFSPEPPEPCG